MICTRVPHETVTGRRVTKVWEWATAKGNRREAEHLVGLGHPYPQSHEPAKHRYVAVGINRVGQQVGGRLVPRLNRSSGQIAVWRKQPKDEPQAARHYDNAQQPPHTRQKEQPKDYRQAKKKRAIFGARLGRSWCFLSTGGAAALRCRLLVGQ